MAADAENARRRDFAWTSAPGHHRLPDGSKPLEMFGPFDRRIIEDCSTSPAPFGRTQEKP
jgi:hypothetical protein